MTSSPRPVFTFGVTHDALWAEELAREEEIPAEIVPAPAAARAPCDLALETLPADVERMTQLLRNAEIPHSLFSFGKDGS